MADLADIRSGLAAALRAALPEDEGHVSAYYGGDALPRLQVAGVDGDGMEYLDMGDPPSRRWTLVIEALDQLVSETGAQTFLDRMLDLVPAALEEDQTLSSRLVNNQVVAGQPAAASGVAFDRFRGQGVRTLDSGGRALVYSFAVTVIS